MELWFASIPRPFVEQKSALTMASRNFVPALLFLSILLVPFASQAQTVSKWTNASGGDWSDASNWDTADAPVNGDPIASSQYVAEIDLATGASYEVLQTGSVGVNGIRLDSVDAVLNIGGILDLENSGVLDVVSGELMFSGFRIRGGSIRLNGTDLQVAADQDVVLDGTNVEGAINLAEDSTIRILDGSRFDQVVMTGRDARIIYFRGFLADGESIDLGSLGVIETYGDFTFETGSYVTGRGSIRMADQRETSITNKELIEVRGSLEIDLVDRSDYGNQFINEGKIFVPRFSALRVGYSPFVGRFGGEFVNTASAVIDVEGRMDVSESWRNLGTINLGENSILNIERNQTTAAVFDVLTEGIVNREVGSVISLEGDFANHGYTFELDDQIGDITLKRTSITGGTINQNGAKLKYSSSSNLLDDVILQGDLCLDNSGATLALDGTIVVTGDIYVGANAGSNNNRLRISDELSATNVLVGAQGNIGNQLIFDSGSTNNFDRITLHPYNSLVLEGEFSSFSQLESELGDSQLFVESELLTAENFYSLLLNEFDSATGCTTLTALALPAIEAIELGSGEVQRSMLTDITIFFATKIDVDGDAFELEKLGTNGGLVEVSIIEQDADLTTSVTLTFSGTLTEPSGSLVDGNYRLTINGDNILIEGGGPLDIDGDGSPGGLFVFGNQESDAFYRLFADSDQNRVVNILDLLGFRQTYLLMTGDASFNETFDANQDGFVDVLDLLRLRQNWLQELPFDNSNSRSGKRKGDSKRGRADRSISRSAIILGQDSFVPMRR